MRRRFCVVETVEADRHDVEERFMTESPRNVWILENFSYGYDRVFNDLSSFYNQIFVYKGLL